MSGAAGKAQQRPVPDAGFSAFVEALLRVVRRDAGLTRRPAADVARREALRLEGQLQPSASRLPSAGVAPGGHEPGRSPWDALRDRAASAGLGVLAQSWPQGSHESLQDLVMDAEAVIRVWGARPQAASRPETSRTHEALQDRRAEAVRYASAAMYEAARAARIPGDDVDRAAAEFACALGERVFGDPGAVFAAPRGPIVAAEHELQQSGGASGRIRGLAFGIRDVAGGAAHGAIRCKAIVGPDGGPEGAS